MRCSGTPTSLALRDESEEDPREAEAHEHDLSYVSLDGTIGCMVNGAGLAMATMDIIKLHGAEPANFLDVGGGASKEKVAAAFKIITADERVKGILVNIFGGIMRCDVIAEGVIAAAKETGLGVPLVVRLEGTNVELGRSMLRDSGLDVITADDLDDAAGKIVKAVGGNAADRRRLALSSSPFARRLRGDDDKERGLTRNVHPGRQENQGHLPGHHRRAGLVPHRAGDRLRHQHGRRRDAGQGRHQTSRTAGVRHRRRGAGGRGRRRHR